MNDHPVRIETADAQDVAATHVDMREMANAGAVPEFNPLQALGRLMRGRWLALFLLASITAGALGATGFLSGKAIYEGKSIIRISAREPSILFADGDDSRLKLFQAFVKGETTYVASHAVMERAVRRLSEDPAVASDDLDVNAMRGSVGIARKDALIIVSAKSSDPEMAAHKANAVVEAYLALHAEYL